MRFTKMNGAGNDFILVSTIDQPMPRMRFSDLARALCDRRRSLGADALILIEPATGEGDFRMRFYNSDGSLGEMCGNGARCICRYGYETGLSGPEPLIETTAGLVRGYRLDQRNYRIRLPDPSVLRLDYPVEVAGSPLVCSYLELGDPGIPHVVVPVGNLDGTHEQTLFDLGRTLRYHPDFPKGANVTFYQITGPDQVRIRTWERGVEGFTLACGTGTGSAVTALTLKGLVSGRHVQVTMPGGTLWVDIDRDGSILHNLWLTGPTSWVADGEFGPEAWAE